MSIYKGSYRLVIILFVTLFTHSIFASEQADKISISTLAAQYQDGQPVEYYVTNNTQDVIWLSLMIEKRDSEGKWHHVKKHSKAMFNYLVKPGQRQRIRWLFWEDSYTLQRAIKSGEYRHVLRVLEQRGHRKLDIKTQPLPVIMTPGFKITRTASR